MKRLEIGQIKEKDVLAKEITTAGGLILIPQGTEMKSPYVDRLKALGITHIYIEDKKAEALETQKMEQGKDLSAIMEQNESTRSLSDFIHEELLKGSKNEEEKIKQQCQNTVRELLEKFSYLGNVELAGIKNVAEKIITDILEEPEVLYSVSGIRSRTELIYSHSINVCALSVLIALKMKLPKEKVKQVAIGSLLHDIGYAYVPEELLYLSHEELSEEEQTELRRHVIYGYEATKREKWLSSAARNIILYHHERLDGSGYPFHLQGEKIKIESRIVAMCDAFDRFVYGIFCEPMKVYRALEELTRRSETAFDFKVLKVFLESVAAYPNGTRVVTNEKELGIVLRQNPKCPTRPVIRMLESNQVVDLVKELNVVIIDTV